VKRVGKQAIFVSISYPRPGVETLLLDLIPAWVKKEP
jgi:hypothetical protein